MSASAGAANVSGLKDAAVRSKSAIADSAGVRTADLTVAYTVLRMSLGMNIALHGVSRLYAGHAAFMAYLNHYFEHAFAIPKSMLPLFGYALPPVETTLGFLLFFGLFTRFTLIAGSLAMLCLVIGTNLAQDWVVSGLQLIYCFLYYYLLAHRDQNVYSVDAFWQR
jgi:thiosulfate dehydrogenase [quinone] large subunit